MRANKRHVSGRNIIIIPELFVCRYIFNGIGQTFSQVVIYLAVCAFVSHKCRYSDNYKYRNKCGEYFYHSCREPAHIGNKRLVVQLCKWFIQNKYQRRQDRNAADNTQKYTLCHYNAKILAKSKAHKAQGNKACNSSDGAACYGGERT